MLITHYSYLVECAIFSLVFFADGNCDAKTGMDNVIDMLNAGVDVVFGAPCSTGCQT